MTVPAAYGEGLVLAIWFILAVAATIPALRDWAVRLDPFDLLQPWNLFAQPRRVDFVLLRRDVLRDGTLTSWHEVEVGRSRRWSDFIWNPGLRARRAFVGLAADLVRATSRYDHQDTPAVGEGTRGAASTMLGVPYLTLLEYVAHRSHPAVQATQFMLVSVAGLGVTGRFDPANPGHIAFASEFHLVGQGDHAESGPSAGRVSARQAD
jgi:hypothetical protein